jgi:hypothetical protein
VVVRLLAKEKVAGPNPVSRSSRAESEPFPHQTSSSRAGLFLFPHQRQKTIRFWATSNPDRLPFFQRRPSPFKMTVSLSPFRGWYARDTVAKTKNPANCGHSAHVRNSAPNFDCPSIDPRQEGVYNESQISTVTEKGTHEYSTAHSDRILCDKQTGCRLLAQNPHCPAQQFGQDFRLTAPHDKMRTC